MEDHSKMGVAVFIQDPSTKEVHQSASYDYNPLPPHVPDDEPRLVRDMVRLTTQHGRY